jgi:type II secretory pathway pseudopilin PulG
MTNFIFILNKRKLKNMRGFTLIETLVGVSLFTFVTFVAISALFSMQTLNTKMKTIKNVYDSMYLVVDDVTRELKQGANYENKNITKTPDTAQSCTADKDCVNFSYLDPENTSVDSEHGYYYDATNFSVYKYTKVGSADTEYQKITKDDVKITKVKFEIVGGASYGDVAPDTQQPMVKFIIKGETKVKPIIPFYIESVISQRSPAS